MQIGLISDTHIPEARSDLPFEVFKALSGVDLILHAGDMHILHVLDSLETLAPVVAARGNGDDPGFVSVSRPGVPDDPRVRTSHVMEMAGVKIGLIHDFPLPGEVPWIPFEAFLDRFFGGPVDVVVCGHTHVAKVLTYQGIIIANPGSPTLPGNVAGLGTVALLELGRGAPGVRIIELDQLS